MAKSEKTLKVLREMAMNTMVEHLGIEFTRIENNVIEGKMPVDHRTIQPHGMLHGGASVTLAETLGSVGATLTVDPEKKICLALEINSNHIKSVKEGYIYGKAAPIHLGKSNQVWEVRITNADGNLVNISRLTLAVIDRKL